MEKTKNFIGIAGITNSLGIGIINIDDLEDTITYCFFSNDTVKNEVETELLYDIDNSEFYFITTDGNKWFLNEFTRV